MKKLFFMNLVFLAAALVATNVFAEEPASRAEVIAKCKEAAEMVLADKEAAIAEIGNPEGRFVWKDTYVFLMDFDGNMLAHPMIPQLTEKGSLLTVTDKNKDKPKLIFVEFVDIAKKNGEGWLWYMWPKPDSREPVDKFTYIRRVGFTDMFVGAGLYH
ncbi:MAG: cache domain-containing protein [Deltaproteobacteria bacterium]|jgi:signal transduction histidine kinase|nr:cache domain-containing protein [Deltaproteobacteria bacterium]